jgi:hypothetical protein
MGGAEGKGGGGVSILSAHELLREYSESEGNMKCGVLLEITQDGNIVEVECQIDDRLHTCPHRFNAPRDDDAGRYVILWEGDENFESLDEWEERLPPALEDMKPILPPYGGQE